MSVDLSTYKRAALLGGFRGLGVLPVLLPIERIKIIKQAHSSKGFFCIARDLYREGGVLNFYKGFQAEAIKVSVKQLAIWPALLGCKQTLATQNFSPYIKDGITGSVVGAVSVFFSAPFERMKFAVRESSGEKIGVNNGWYGCVTQVRKVSFQWSSFLLIQRYFKSQYLLEKEILTGVDIVDIGVRSAIVVTLVSAPLDRAHALKQVHKIGFFKALKKEPFWKMYKGCHLIALTGIVNGIATTALLDWIDRGLVDILTHVSESDS